MVCSKCGQECADDVKFCTNCGVELIMEEKEAAAEAAVAAEEAAVPEPAEAEVTVATEEKVETAAPAEPKEKKEKKPLNKKLLGGVAAAVVLFLLLLAAVSVCNNGADYVTAGKNAILEIVEVDDKVLVLYEDGDVDELKYERCYNTCYSQDRSAAVFENEDEELILVRKGKVTETGIEDAYNVVVSVYGDTIAYLSDVEADFQANVKVGILNLYYTKNGKTKEIAEDVLYGSPVLSPDGQTVAFVSDYDASDDFKGYYSVKGKKPVEVGKEKYVIAIADKAAYLYYRDADRLYAQKRKRDGEKLASDLGSVSVFVNADCTELMYTVDGKAYLSVKAGEKEKVSNDSVSRLLLPPDALQDYGKYNTARGNVMVYHTGVATLKEQLYWTEGDISYLNGKKEMNTVASSVMDYEIAEDGESLVYVDYSGDVNRVTKFSKGGEKKTVKEDAEATDIYASGDLKYVYYVNEDDELYCIKGKKAKKLADDVTEVAVSGDGRLCYYVIEDEELCYSKKNGKRKSILSEDDVYISCDRIMESVIVTIVNDDDESTYYFMDGKKMNELFTEE